MLRGVLPLINSIRKQIENRIVRGTIYNFLQDSGNFSIRNLDSNFIVTPAHTSAHTHSPLSIAAYFSASEQYDSNQGWLRSSLLYHILPPRPRPAHIRSCGVTMDQI